MTRRRRGLGFASVHAVLVALLAHSSVAMAEASDAAIDGEDPTYVRDAQGREMRVRFDPGSRWALGAAPVGSLKRASIPRGEEAGLDTSVELSTQLAGRNAVDVTGEGIRYKIYHVVFDTRLDVPTDGDGYALDATLYDVRFIRWASDGSVLIPTSPPVRLPFPFGLGFRAQLGHLELAEHAERAEIGVTQVELRLDLWRRRDLGSYAELGAASSYRIDVWSEEGSARTDHLVAPFSLGTMTLHHESADGHQAFSAALEGGLLLSTSGDQGLTGRAQLGYESIVIALNDWPVSLFAEASARADELERPVSAARELRVSSGLRLSAPLD